jgi:hypothetical protein
MRHLLYILLAVPLLSACVKNNPDPSWLEVTEWTLQANVNSQEPTGELTHNFSDAWVYVDDKVIGVFQVPFKIPLLLEGNVNIKIYPAVRNNGISATKKIYPFVEVFEVNTTLVKNQVLTLNPVTRYNMYTRFWIADFEDANTKIEKDDNSQADLITNNDPEILMWGNYYGEVNLNTTDSIWIAYTNEDTPLPKGKEVYLELNYYNTNSVVTGVIAISPTNVKNHQHIRLNAQKPEEVKWKKIYIDLKEIISSSTDAVYFRQSFQAILDAGDSEGKIILDNIKVVYF